MFCVLVQKIKDLIHAVSRTDHTEADAFILFIMSHGERGFILGIDEKRVNIEDEIISVIGGCRSLWNKPKMLFFQACRGARNFVLPQLIKSVSLHNWK